jgi:Ni,Fe-hydrogenase III large subunit
MRGEFLNLSLDLCGNRFGRSLVQPGGVRFDLTKRQQESFSARLDKAERDVHNVVDLLFAVPTVVSRFEQAGPLSREVAEALGLVGPVARASNCDRDVRRDHPSGIYRFAHVPVATAATGDVMARALVRSLEARRSLEFLREQLGELRAGAALRQVPAPKPGRLVISLVEGWRGQIAHLVEVGADGLVCGYKVVDPSFYNWFGLAMAMRGQPISDFPLCNKSFDLSYAGHDL